MGSMSVIIGYGSRIPPAPDAADDGAILVVNSGVFELGTNKIPKANSVIFGTQPMTLMVDTGSPDDISVVKIVDTEARASIIASFLPETQ
jgi:hypothetical protein